MAKPTGMPNGRPSLYTTELAEDICFKISTSTKGLKILCKENPTWPDESTIRAWIREKDGFSHIYAKAKLDQADLMAEEIISIADDTSNDTLIKLDKNGEQIEVCNSEWINRSRLRVDTRKWLASRLAPKVYGDRIHNEATITVKQEDAIKELG